MRHTAKCYASTPCLPAGCATAILGKGVGHSMCNILDTSPPCQATHTPALAALLMSIVACAQMLRTRPSWRSSSGSRRRCPPRSSSWIRDWRQASRSDHHRMLCAWNQQMPGLLYKQSSYLQLTVTRQAANSRLRMTAQLPCAHTIVVRALCVNVRCLVQVRSTMPARASSHRSWLICKRRACPRYACVQTYLCAITSQCFACRQ